MASITMTASFLGGAAAAAVKHVPSGARRGAVVVRASSEPEKMAVKAEEKSNSSRRDMMFAVAAAAACSVANVCDGRRTQARDFRGEEEVRAYLRHNADGPHLSQLRRCCFC
ncbi:hypothetical protein Sango_0408700 [Sesamum angolense]|uniref:Uncharacterized protein n=1 Tax=Sesamum angolense TaxID=2727404 RepID=A0AAE1XAD8_9LAMI|nr:hypothetical protein Sango_0408700 [Sesamum angolense]